MRRGDPKGTAGTDLGGMDGLYFPGPIVSLRGLRDGHRGDRVNDRPDRPDMFGMVYDPKVLLVLPSRSLS